MQEGSRTFTNTLKISNLRSILEILFIKKSRAQNVIVGGLCFSVIRLLCSIISYCQIGVIVRYLLPRDFGLWAIVSSFNIIFSITFNFGIGNALQNKVSKLYAQRNDEESPTYNRGTNSDIQSEVLRQAPLTCGKQIICQICRQYHRISNIVYLYVQN